MAKTKNIFVCQRCGATSPKWIGKCTQCGEWNTYIEEIQVTEKKSLRTSQAPLIKNSPQKLSDVKSNRVSRFDSGIGELNRVLGGGIVPGSMVLLGGDPGIGKSTLILQAAISEKEQKLLYVSGEESLEQIKLRADRLSNNRDQCYFLSETLLEVILQHVENEKPDLLIIDSIQTIFTDQIESAAGSVSQIRECASAVMKVAKRDAMAVILIGHINKEGNLAGPKVLEHMVDTVLQFEGDRNHMYRILRSAKNRFGPTTEIGIFEMLSSGLREVENPSELLIHTDREGLSGTTTSALVEGNRPFLIEIQALVSSAAYGNPQRSATGFDIRRLNMLLAVLEKRAGFKLVTKDVFLNIAGGIKVVDPAIDLSVICAVLSSNFDLEVPNDICFTGEVGLTGEVRPVTRIEQRVSEAEKTGFKRIFLPFYNKLEQKTNRKIEVIRVKNVQETLKRLFQ